jgi:hypothetical protein
LPRLARPRLLPLLLVLLAALVALPVAGCGSGGGGDENADPAKVAPAGSLIYFRATIRPQGSQKSGVEAIAKKVFRVSDPGPRLEAYLQKKGEQGDPKFSYRDDVKPWLGRNAAIAVSSFAGGGGHFAAIVASKDNGKAKDFIDKVQKGKSHSYKGSDYSVDSSDGSAAGVVDDFVVVGKSEADFKGVVDAAKGDSLADSDRYKKTAAQGSGKLGFGYFDARNLASSLSALGSQGQAASQLLAGANQGPATATVEASEKALTLDVSAQRGKQAGAAGTATPLVLALPGDAWLAAGVPRVGQTLRKLVNSFSSGLAGGFIRTFEDQIRRQTGVDINRDVFAAIGDLAIFARGTSPLTVGGGVVIQSPNPDAANRLVTKLSRLIQKSGSASGVKVGRASIAGAKGVTIRSKQLPGDINAVVKGDRLVIAYGGPATNSALKPTTKLGDSASFKAGADSLGGAQPTLFVDFDPISRLVGASSQTPNARKAQTYLEGLSTLAVGSRTEGDRQIGRFVITVK